MWASVVVAQGLSCSRSSRVMLLVRSWRRVPYSAMTGVGGTRRQDAELELQDLVHSLALPTSSALPGMCPELRLGRPGLEGEKEDPKGDRSRQEVTGKLGTRLKSRVKNHTSFSHHLFSSFSSL